jgi:hypothetical protein
MPAYKPIDELVRSRGLMLIGGLFNLAAKLAIVLGHNVWSGGLLTVVVTLTGEALHFEQSPLGPKKAASCSH